MYLKFTCVKTHGDATSSYTVTPDTMSISELLEICKNRAEYGYIRDQIIRHNEIYINYDYKFDCFNSATESELNHQIKIKSTEGGYGRMDYIVEFLESDTEEVNELF